MEYPPKLSPAFSGTLRTFSYWIATGSVGSPLLKGIEYRQIMLKEPSLMEQAYAIFANVIEFERARPSTRSMGSTALRNGSGNTVIPDIRSHRRSKVGRSNCTDRRRGKTRSPGHR
jgi:hypothetical protein